MATLNKTNNNDNSSTYSVTGGYLSQSGKWKIDLVVQRLNAYDLNHSFEANLAASSDMNNMDMGNYSNRNNATMVIAEPAPPAFDSFAWLAIGLSIAVAAISTFYFKRSKQQLRQSVKLFEKD